MAILGVLTGELARDACLWHVHAVVLGQTGPHEHLTAVMHVNVCLHGHAASCSQLRVGGRYLAKVTELTLERATLDITVRVLTTVSISDCDDPDGFRLVLTLRHSPCSVICLCAYIVVGAHVFPAPGRVELQQGIRC